VTALAPTLQAFFTDRLARQRHASPHTIAAYRDTWRLLLGYAAHRTSRQPSHLDLADLDARRSIRCSATRRCATPSTPR
jgi:site-specific recombinase XerC